MVKSNASPPAVDGSKNPSTPSREAIFEDASETVGNDSVFGLAWISIWCYVIYRIIFYAYRIRMAAIDEYGPVIHEFDPYFNYRATEVRK